MIWGLIGLILILGSVILMTIVYQKDLRNKDKEINRLNIRLQHLNDYNIKILSINDELIKENQDLKFTLSLVKSKEE